MSAHTFFFYSADLAPSVRLVWLTGDEHFHLVSVLRKRAGDVIRITNGRGLIASAEIESIDTKRACAMVLSLDETRPEPVPLVLALGLMPNAHMEAALTQCTEAGMTGMIPIVAERSHARRVIEANEPRWVRLAVAAIKQSGRAWMPVLEGSVDARKLVERFDAFERVYVADQNATGVLDPAAPPASTLALVGPEAGFTAAELERFVAAGARPVRLSAQRLRAETAALALVAMLAANRGLV